MESNGYEHHLFKAVEALSVIANQAYWKDRKDCGSDFHADTCGECQHFVVCQTNLSLKQALDTLTEWGC